MFVDLGIYSQLKKGKLGYIARLDTKLFILLARNYNFGIIFFPHKTFLYLYYIKKIMFVCNLTKLRSNQ